MNNEIPLLTDKAIDFLDREKPEIGACLLVLEQIKEELDNQLVYFCKSCDKVVKDYQIGHECSCGSKLIVKAMKTVEGI